MSEDWGPRAGRRRNKQWRPVSHGLHLPLAFDGGPTGDLTAWQLVLPPEGCFTHLTAAAQYGWWLPPVPDGLPVFACQPAGTTYPRRAGLHVRRHPVLVPWQLRNGLRLALPGEALLACARDLALIDLVVLIDAALYLKTCSTDEIAQAASERRAGAPRLRKALALSDGRSESAWETLLRILHVVCDVPVEPQHEVYDDQGRLVATGDLWIRGTRTFHEYDGGEHLKKSRQRRDLRRGRAVSNIRWTRRGYTSEDVLHQAVGVLRDADLALGRPHDPARIRAWHALLPESMFTPSGRARLLRKLGLSASESAHEFDAG